MKMHKQLVLKLSEIILDNAIQPRSRINNAVVKKYAEAMRQGSQFPPVVVFYDDSKCWLADGFHRVNAKESVGEHKILAEVKLGSRRDAILFAVGANALHGLQRTNEDKRRSVEKLLCDPEWSLWSNCEIAKQCQVDEKTVRRAKKKLTQTKQICSSSVHTSQCLARRNGKVQQMNVSNIGSNSAGKKDISNLLEPIQQANISKNFSWQSVSSTQDTKHQTLSSRQIRILNTEIVTSKVSNNQYEVYSCILSEGPAKAWSIILTQMQAHPDFAESVWQLAQDLMTHTN